jgi:hypothetical protein
VQQWRQPGLETQEELLQFLVRRLLDDVVLNLEVIERVGDFLREFALE